MANSFYRYFLFAWCDRWQCYWPAALYASKAYAMKAASRNGYTDFYIKRVIPGLRYDDSIKLYLDNCQHLDHVKNPSVEVEICD